MCYHLGMGVFTKHNAAFLLAGLTIGLLIVLQLRSDTAYVGSHPLDEYESQQELIAIFHQQYPVYLSY